MISNRTMVNMQMMMMCNMMCSTMCSMMKFADPFLHANIGRLSDWDRKK